MFKCSDHCFQSERRNILFENMVSEKKACENLILIKVFILFSSIVQKCVKNIGLGVHTTKMEHRSAVLTQSLNNNQLWINFDAFIFGTVKTQTPYYIFKNRVISTTTLPSSTKKCLQNLQNSNFSPTNKILKLFSK